MLGHAGKAKMLLNPLRTVASKALSVRILFARKEKTHLRPKASNGLLFQQKIKITCQRHFRCVNMLSVLCSNQGALLCRRFYVLKSLKIQSYRFEFLGLFFDC